MFSQTSLQASHISPATPRALYFDTTTAIGWVPGADELEIAVHEPQQGVVFYTLSQTTAQPRFIRQDSCLLCHLSWETLGVPGMLMLSTFQMPDDPNAYATGIPVDHRTPLPERWGGWYVTGSAGTSRHRGNIPIVVDRAQVHADPQPAPPLLSVSGRVSARGYPTSCSDIAALMVLSHQVRMTNLLTRTGWESRVAAHEPQAARDAVASVLSPRVEAAIRELVDYMLFVDEAPFAQPIESSCGFAERFSSQGPRDRRGRSFYQLDLNSRLLRHRFSYMVYTPAFDALPQVTKEAVYRRLWDILSDTEQSPPYSHLSRDDRRAIAQVLLETKDDLPSSFQLVGE